MGEKIKFLYLDENTTDGDRTFPTHGTQLDLERHGMSFKEGQRYWFWRDDGDARGNDDPVLMTGVAHFDNENNKWFVVIDKDSGQRYSESNFRKEYTITDIQGPGYEKN